MSPNVGNFVHDLVEMAKAMETLPQVQAELDRANTQIENYAKQVQDREIAIIGYKEEIETLHAKVRSLEVERDDASFRVLESEDLVHECLSGIDTMQSTLGKLKLKLDPPKPEPVKEPEPEHVAVHKWDDTTPAEGQSALDPTKSMPMKDGYGTVLGLPDAVNSIQDVGQSEGSPTVNTGQVEKDVHSVHATPTDVGSTSVETSSDKPYLGKRYFDISGYVSRSDWEQGGGTEEDYNWRPTVPSSY